MQKARWLTSICCAASLGASGCGSNQDAGAVSDSRSTPSIAVVQVETITTVQSSAGSFLSPTPEQVVPAYVERNTEQATAAAAEREERAKIDVALLFHSSAAAGINQTLDVQLASGNAAAWSTIEHCFPHAEQNADQVRWPLALSSTAAADLDSSISAEWRGWQDFRGLGVRGRGLADLSVPAATLDFEASGLSSPLVLSAQGGSLLVTNRSSHAIARALLIYSHSGGVGVTELASLAPGERALTLLGPKEHPADVLLQLARQQLADFFAESVGTELGSAMAAAKSIPFLETQGLRLVSLLTDELEPVAVSFSASLVSQKRVIVSHSEILKPEEEARVLGIVPDLDADQALSALGRFTRAKLEFAEQDADPGVSARASSLLSELRGR